MIHVRAIENSNCTLASSSGMDDDNRAEETYDEHGYHASCIGSLAGSMRLNTLKTNEITLEKPNRKILGCQHQEHVKSANIWIGSTSSPGE
jgi:hypothetical protein